VVAIFARRAGDRNDWQRTCAPIEIRDVAAASADITVHASRMPSSGRGKPIR
jgi:hypothetical protein